MNLRGRYFQLLDYIDESPWRTLIEGDAFWNDAGTFAAAESNNLYFTLMKYDTMIHACADRDPLSAFGAPVPDSFSAHPETMRLCQAWAQAHTALYGAGHTARLGLFVFQPGGSAPYHIDGNVFRAGQAVDLERPGEWNLIAFQNASRRTLMPILLNPEDEFLIMGEKIRMTPGLLFEFSNCLPHAFFNKGRQPTVLLVTNYIADSDRFQPHVVRL